MATTVRLYCAINEGGDAQEPTEDVNMMLKNPAGVEHTAWGAATPDADFGTGAFYREFSIADDDPSGLWALGIKTETDGGKTPMSIVHVAIK